jgi:DNA polymerase I-like protein with 3'-5' exonuclease and polymerase domains
VQLQVHDELDLTIWSSREAKQLNEIMVHAVELNVPTVCDIEVGPTWGEIGIAA